MRSCRIQSLGIACMMTLFTAGILADTAFAQAPGVPQVIVNQDNESLLNGRFVQYRDQSIDVVFILLADTDYHTTDIDEIPDRSNTLDTGFFETAPKSGHQPERQRRSVMAGYRFKRRGA